MDKWVKLSIVAGVLMAGFGVFYHFVVFLPSLEREKKAAYAVCMQKARSNYDESWAAECRTMAERKKLDLQNCLADPTIINNQVTCPELYGDADPSLSCSLIRPTAETLNGYLREAEAKCVTEAKLGL
jgi:hypothetical protein